MSLSVKTNPSVSQALFLTTQAHIDTRLTLLTKISWHIFRWTYRFRSTYSIAKHPDNWRALVLAGGITGSAETFSWIKTALQIVLIGKCLHSIIETHWALRREWQQLVETLSTPFPRGFPYPFLAVPKKNKSLLLSSGEKFSWKQRKKTWRTRIYATRYFAKRVWRTFVRCLNLYADTVEIATGSSFALYHHTVELLAVKKQDITRLREDSASLALGLRQIESIFLLFMRHMGINEPRAKAFHHQLIETIDRGEQAATAVGKTWDQAKNILKEVFEDDLLFADETLRRSYENLFVRKVEAGLRSRGFRQNIPYPDFAGQKIILSKQGEARPKTSLTAKDVAFLQ